MKADVSISSDAEAAYPLPDDCYDPSEKYPEYGGHVSDSKNDVYRMVRECLHGLGYDEGNYGTEKWNPLSEVIAKGDTVLVKPNWVLDHNNEKTYHDMECMVTNPSLIRAVLDYVVKALDGTGRIIVGDAPIQRCDLDALLESMNYNLIWKHYEDLGVKIEVMDFRGLVANVFNQTSSSNDKGILVSLTEDSAFYGCDESKIERMRVTNYPTKMMEEHHTVQHHEYYIHPAVLEADVIINLPKPKSHRMAGMTACCKNFVGANSRKECLPHHTIGAPETGGDEYWGKNNLHDMATMFTDKYNNLSYDHSYLALGYLAISMFFSKSGRLLTNEKFNNGCWHGNDTIWRTILDLNHIVRHSDKEGKICQDEQRRILNICDMIVSGEKEGPLTPSPKKVGAIVAGRDCYRTDYIIAKMFGFDPMKVKYLKNSSLSFDGISVYLDGKVVPQESVEYDDSWIIDPTIGWKDHIERQT